MALNTAIRHLRNGDWAKAHAVVQNDPSQMGCWAHGIVHMLEGDIGNARYWYRRAGRPFPRERDASAEIDALVAHMKAQTQGPATQSPALAAPAGAARRKDQQAQGTPESPPAQHTQQAAKAATERTPR